MANPSNTTVPVVDAEIVEAQLVSTKLQEWDQNSPLIHTEVNGVVPGAPVGAPCQACGAPREGQVAFVLPAVRLSKRLTKTLSFLETVALINPQCQLTSCNARVVARR